MVKNIFIAVAWPYVNGDIHVGHLAGYLLPADAVARWARLKGYQVLMVSGADCHGTPITLEAEKKSIQPQQLIDLYLPKIHRLIKIYDLSYDLFTSTQTKNHFQVTQDIFLNLLKNGYIFKKTAKQYYSQSQKRFLPDRYVEGECPYCHSLNQRSDQCEECGRVLNFGQLINPISKLDQQPVSLKETEHYYLDYAKLQPLIEKFVDKSRRKWRPWIWRETKGWLDEGLEPRPITRDIGWGIPLPIDKIPKNFLLKDIERKRFYVWFEAVIGYLSASIEWSQKQKQPELYRQFWFNPASRHYYFMGQDNLAFHTIFWPGQLIGQDLDYNLPDYECVNKFLNLAGQKFSKSRKVIIDSVSVAEKYGLDAVRFYIFSILPENRQASWQWSEFEKVVNANLVDTLANFIQRVLLFYKNYLSETIEAKNRNISPEVDRLTAETYHSLNDLIAKSSLVASLNKILDYSRFGNLYLNQKQPWQLIKTNPNQAQEVIFSMLYLSYNLAFLIYPFLPNLSRKIFQSLGLPPVTEQLNSDQFQPHDLPLSEIKIGTSLFPLVEKIKIDGPKKP